MYTPSTIKSESNATGLIITAAIVIGMYLFINSVKK
jgi:hypothetical protein